MASFNPNKVTQKDDETDQYFEFYNKFDETRGKALRKEWYNQATAAYIEARPRYPDNMVQAALKEANLWSEDNNKNCHILEVGCGPGTATISLVKMGYQVTAIDPAPQNCIAARKHCQEALGGDETMAAEKVTVVESTFEDFEYDPTKPISAILCPTSFHWISPEVACTKTAEILRPTKGCLLLWWAMPPMPMGKVCERLQDIFDDLGESELGRDMQKYSGKDFSKSHQERVYQSINTSGVYEVNDKPLQLQSASFRYTPEKFIRLLSTMSAYIALEKEKRLTLFERLRHRLLDICEEQGQKDMDLTGYFGFQCFWVKNDEVG
jgi:SAM-dependent methyltransferase